MNYWHMNLHPTGEKGTNKWILDIVLSRTIGMGFWERNENEIEPAVKDFITRVEVGDIIAVLNGTNPIALVKVISDCYIFDEQGDSLIWFTLRRAIKILCHKGECDYVKNLPQFPSRTKSLKIARDKSTDTYKYIDEWYKYCKNRNNLGVKNYDIESFDWVMLQMKKRKNQQSITKIK